MIYILFIVLVCASSLRAEEWSPPRNPDPETILDEAEADARAKRYETALVKHVWFHENALAIEPALYGVRLSFALSDWVELAKKYPPALAKLKEVRDTANEKVLQKKDVRLSFHDAESINSYLNEDVKTKKLFELLDAKHPKIAKEVFDLAQPSLVKSKEYALIGKYISPASDFTEMRESFRQDIMLAKDPRFGPDHLDFANKNFENETTTLVAILVINDRKKEAEEIAKSARAEWSDRAFHSALEKALKGKVPAPWP